MMRISRVHQPVTALGPGRRLGIWVQGCSIHCAGCLARDTWDPAAGGVVAVAELAARWAHAVGVGITGLTITGGEPLDQPEALVELLRAVRARSADRAADVLVYTGYELTEVSRRAPALTSLADALITGPFDITDPTKLIWRGSANQRLHLLSPLGRERCGPYLGQETERPPVQVTVDEDRIWYVGVPRAGDLVSFERAVRGQGVDPGTVTWRP